MLGLRQVLLNIYCHFRYYIPKYKVDIIWYFFILPISSIIFDYLHGKFVKTVSFLGFPVNYFSFLIISTLIADACRSIIFNVVFEGRRFPRKDLLFDENIFVSPLSRIGISFTRRLTRFSYYYPFVILFVGVKKFLLILFLYLIVSILGFYLVPLILTMKMILRKEFEIIEHTIFQISKILFPVTFSLYYFIPNYFIIFLPPASLLELARELLVFDCFNLKFLFLSFLVSIAYSIISLGIFKKVFEKGRKEGWVWLE